MTCPSKLYLSMPCLSMPCLSILYFSIPCLSILCPTTGLPLPTSFPTTTCPAPPVALQKCSLMSLIHHWRTSLHLSTSISASILNWASRHFLKIVDCSCPFLRNQVLRVIWIGKGRYPGTRNSGKCWFLGYFSVISKHDGKIEDWMLPMLLSLGLVPINRYTRNYS